MALDSTQIKLLLKRGEDLQTEFKSEAREAVPDREIYEVVVCFANSSGGTLLLGVENDGRITGARHRHGITTDPHKIRAAVFNNTVPPVNTRVSILTTEGGTVIVIEVDPYPEVCATREGKALRRVVGIDGPECIPFYPHEHMSRRSDLGLADYSSVRIEGATWRDLDPLEIERLRQTIRRRRGEPALLDLDDRELVKALRLVTSDSADLVPNVAGMLLVGRQSAIEKYLPTHEVAFQALGPRGGVLVNEWFRGPVVQILDAVEERFRARNQEREVQVGMIRLPIPDYSLEAFREAVNNAVQHRDYTCRGPVFIQFYPDRLFVSNVGGFPEGIHLNNLLVHEPKPRNALLSDALRRIGLVETTARGVDKIYLGQLVYGRLLPDYSQSDRSNVRLNIRSGEPSIPFAAFVFEQDKAGRELTLDELLTVNHLQHERSTDAVTIGALTQQGESHGRAVLERLVERGLIEGRGERKRTYLLSATLYRRLGAPAGYVRAHGFDLIRQEAMVLQFVEAHGRISRRDVTELCSLGGDQASRLLRKLVREKKLELVGERRGAYYRVLDSS
jgi:ATP-dependent DNA helicase RecG